MRIEFEKLLKKLDSYSLFYLEGPVGSGKTHITREFLSLFIENLKERGEPREIFTLYSGFSFQTDFEGFSERDVSKEIFEAQYTFSGELNNKSCSDALKSLELFSNSEQEQGLCNTILGWKKIFKVLMVRDYQFIVILDDYDIWRSGKTDEGFTKLLELQQKGVRFLLTSRVRACDLDKGEKEKDFLWKVEVVSIRLPSRDDAIKIAQDCWKALEKKQESAVSPPILLDEHYEQIIEITGRYPGMISQLMEIINESFRVRKSLHTSSEERKSEISKLIQIAKSQNKFYNLICHLWNSLSNSEREFLALITVSQKAHQSLKKVYENWQRHEVEHIRSWQDMMGDFKRLKDDRLLVASEENEFIIPSSALIDFVWEQEITKELAGKIEIAKDIFHFNQKTFWKLWLIGTLVYLVLVFIVQPFLKSRGIFLSESLVLSVWAPALFYFLIYAFQTAFSK